MPGNRAQLSIVDPNTVRLNPAWDSCCSDGATVIGRMSITVAPPPLDPTVTASLTDAVDEAAAFEDRQPTLAVSGSGSSRPSPAAP